MSESSQITREEVAHVAHLARIELTEAELDHLRSDLDAILEHVKVVQSVVDADTPAMSHPIPVTNVFRLDLNVAGLTADEALAGAPESEEQRFLVPRILGED
ncbi:MAG: Asp-tRNA(Asn)/Glu-tRNA(Gln) amidotransferase subunit GatC [Aeromicrobium sp.]|nr:MAG: Asp-tRNA(Asn)/Glu-tRNA(Gln) amidotransferase subunit GatC [Aeromicrobium sp.]